MSSKRTKALAISPKVRAIVKERDKWCILCGTTYGLQVAHFISRGAGGLGIPQNLVLLCINCHRQYDQSKHRPELRKKIKSYLEQHYSNIKEEQLKYENNRNSKING